MADDAVDILKPWTIKSVSSRVSEDITATARRENLTTGQLLERVWDHWKADGRPSVVDRHSTPSEFVAILHALAPIITANPRGLAAIPGLSAAINDKMRELRGLPGRQPRQTQQVIPGQTTKDDL